MTSNSLFEKKPKNVMQVEGPVNLEKLYFSSEKLFRIRQNHRVVFEIEALVECRLTYQKNFTGGFRGLFKYKIFTSNQQLILIKFIYQIGLTPENLNLLV